MGRLTVSKEFTFDCAHMLTGHEALCKNLHGHTYKVQVKVYDEQITEGSSAEMVIDFKYLKKAIEECIKDLFDHALILSSESFRGEAENELLRWAEKYGMRHYDMPSRTTAENMAIHFADCFVHIQRNKFDLGIGVCKHIKDLVGKSLPHKINTLKVEFHFFELFQTAANAFCLGTGDRR